MKNIVSYLQKNPIISEYLSFVSLRQENTLYVEDVNDEAALTLIASAWISTDRSFVVVLPNLYKAQQTYDRLSVLLGGEGICFFPQDEFITAELLTSSYELKIERLHTIAQILSKKRVMVITHVAGYVKAQVPLSQWKSAKISLISGEDYPQDTLIKQLSILGYKREYTVEKPGDFGVRGGIIDVFPIDAIQPVRLDYFGDTIEDIKVFEVDSQRSVDHTSNVEILPVHEFFFSDEQVQPLISFLTQAQDSIVSGKVAKEKVIQDIEHLQTRDNLDRLVRYIPMVFGTVSTLVDFFVQPMVFFVEEHRIQEQIKIIAAETTDWFLSMGDYLKIGFTPYLTLKDVTPVQSVHFDTFHAHSTQHFTKRLSIPSKTPVRYEGDYDFLVKDVAHFSLSKAVLILVKNIASLEHLCEELDSRLVSYRVIGPEDDILQNQIQLLINDQYFDAVFDCGNLAVITDQLISRKLTPSKKGRYRSITQNTKRLTSVNDLKPGDYVVHYDYGIGRFLEIVTMELGKTKNDYIHIEYKDGDKLYIQFDAIDQIQKYAGSEGFQPRLSKLGGSDWSKTKQRVRAKVQDIAEKLIMLYAEREKSVGYAFLPDDSMQKDFEEDFEYVETPDQQRAIDEVKRDMETAKPMDRLLCGDVGFGKTEIALRAAFKAVMSGKQVAYLAPTTVLAKQHANTFKRRMEKFGIKVALLNRFVSRKEQKQALLDLQSGQVDVLIGTHRILSQDVKFKDLGLLVIDEEQRFGVEHKEKIKEMKVNVDVISLSATPIPRTLQMAIMGVKNMSLLETAPENRYPIQTYVLERNDTVIKDAIERELARNGQVFYLYNRVEDIHNIETYIKRMVPEARIQIAHGQMSKIQLENVVDDFIEQKIDVLVATTIIETGIDIPNANTLIIHDADRLGLSQLYQIRGRVGRSNRIAYAYLMYQKNKILTEDAEKRLKVIKEFTELGSGFKIAVRDLSIRGAGDVLGSEQSGFIDSVGIDLYLKILQEEVAYQQGNSPVAQPIARIKAQVSKFIDKTYVEDDFVKLEMHGKINSVRSKEQLEDLLFEFSDRFGTYQGELELYLYEKLFEHYSLVLDVEKLQEAKTNVTLTISEEGTKKLAGDKLFTTGVEVSKFLRFAYKDHKIQIILDTIRLDKHWLYTMCDFLEKIV